MYCYASDGRTSSDWINARLVGMGLPELSADIAIARYAASVGPVPIAVAPEEDASPASGAPDPAWERARLWGRPVGR